MRLAGAPITWGVCEVPGWGEVLPPATVLADMAALGLTATELGPPDYLPADPDELHDLLAAHDLALVGGFLATPLHEPGAVAEAERAAERLARAGGDVLVLAAATGLDGYDARPELTPAQWTALLRAAEAARDAAAAHGVRTALHPHVGTHVERATEVGRLLAESDVPLCLDTGHLLIGGADPLELASRHPDRIGHVHLKDVRADLATEVREGRTGYAAAVRRGLYPPLGEGDLDVPGILTALRINGYGGWLVLEQDTALDAGATSAGPVGDTARGLAFLHPHLG
ncbi:TIM barrel protein [Actinosynnema mirum]|uniref:Xylose isomerase domain protein TIM barrel n=1 Tax=Actinosynnema mirum (strain ATCC 29888 / DSM 43827 / JCM 3225 / NBRC 14064 / NCIMB 13271 / NRRL B-12336 / IMRU 3971 / 101) TaxID=446462 RepID=C6WPU7_ACTMD|nr:TIM barrel protein [Actinosynnema mirum]ACU40648.1 Xylose isomerase domain protein TIM barrel [Actinosynnema mirum DSM 43827]